MDPPSEKREKGSEEGWDLRKGRHAEGGTKGINPDVGIRHAPATKGDNSLCIAKAPAAALPTESFAHTSMPSTWEDSSNSAKMGTRSPSNPSKKKGSPLAEQPADSKSSLTEFSPK